MATLHLRHLNGKEALEKFLAAIAEFYDGNVVRQVFIHTNLVDGHVRLENVATRVLASQLPIKKLADLLTERPFLYCRQIIVAFDHGEAAQYSTDGILAAIDITGPSHMPPERFADQLIRITDVLGKYFTLTRKSDALTEHLTAEQKDGLRHYEQALSDLTTQTAHLGRLAATQMQESQKILDQRLADLEKRYEQRAQTLEADHQDRCQQLDRRAQDLEAQYEQRRQALEPEYQARKQDLERREQELKAQLDQERRALAAADEARTQELQRREQELKAQLEQQLRAFQAADEARKQDLERREQELKNRYEQRVRTLDADHETRCQDLDRRQQELEERYEQRAQTLEADYQAKRLDLDRRAEELKTQAEHHQQSLESSYQAKTQELNRREQELEKRYEQRAKTLETDYQAKRLDLERRAEELKSQAENHQRAMESNVQNKTEELNRREQELKALAQQYDMHARAMTRRDLVQKMQELLDQQKQIAPPPELEQKRKTLQQVCLGVLAGLGALLIFVVVAVVLRQQTPWHQTLLPLTVVTLGFGATLAFYLRTSQQSFADHARSESFNRKLASDILRANWIAELYLESKENSRIDLPEGLLLTFAQGLFSPPSPNGSPTPLKPPTPSSTQTK